MKSLLNFILQNQQSFGECLDLDSPILKNKTQMNNKFKKDIIGWDINNWGESLNFFDKNIDYSTVKKVLELGAFSKSGGYTLHFAEKKLNVICSGYYEPDEKLKSIHNRYNLKKYIKYRRIDASDIKCQEKFDIVCFKSMLGGIAGKWDKSKVALVLDEIYKSLNKNGYLVFSENLYSTRVHNTFRRLSKDDNWHYFKKDELNNLISDIKFEIISQKTLGFLGCFGRNEYQRSFLSLFDRLFFNHFIPSEYHYILFSVLKKI